MTMQARRDESVRPAIVSWFQELLRGPVTSYGDYFEILRETVISSAPERVDCR